MTGREVLEDVLVLRVENSIDYYAEVAAVLKRSCFGLRLLTHTHTSHTEAHTHMYYAPHSTHSHTKINTRAHTHTHRCPSYHSYFPLS